MDASWWLTLIYPVRAGRVRVCVCVLGGIRDVALCFLFCPISRLDDTDLFWTVARVNGLLLLLLFSGTGVLASVLISVGGRGMQSERGGCEVMARWCELCGREVR